MLSNSKVWTASKSVYSFLKEVMDEFLRDECMQMAAALAYYMAFSLAPILIITMFIAGFFFDSSDIHGQISQEVDQVLGDQGSEQVKEILDNAAKWEAGGVAGLLSVAALIFGASGVVVQLQQSLNNAWSVEPDPKQNGLWNFLTKRLISVAMVLSLGFVLVVSLAISSVMNMLDERLVGLLPGLLHSGVASLFDLGVTGLILLLLFAAIFKFLPDANVRWRDVGVGALLTAVLFVVGKFGLAAYLGSQSLESSFGAAGSLALILLWVYYSGLIFLFGAEFTQVWARRLGAGITPQKGAVRVRKKIEHV